MTSVEERLRDVLEEVAGRVDPGPAREFDVVPVPHSRRWPLFATAAVMVALAGIGIAVWAQHDDKGQPVAAVNGPKTVLTARLDGTYAVDLQLLDGTDRCVRIHYGEGDEYGRHPQVCLGGKPIAIEEATRGGETQIFTIIYGVAAKAEQVHMNLIGGVKGHLEQRVDGRDVVFVAVVDDPAASGQIWSTDGDRQVAFAPFDHAGPPRPEKQLLEDGELIDIAFNRDGAVWAVTTLGRQIRLTDGSVAVPDGYGFAAPDGHTVVFSRENQTNYWAEIALDARTGKEVEIDTVGSHAFSPDGTRVAGALPIDDEVPIDVVILDLPLFTGRRVITVPTGGKVGSLAVDWDVDNTHLLASAFQGTQMWMLDTSTLTSASLQGDVPDDLVIANAIAPGRFPAISSKTKEFGFVEVRGSSVSFRRIRVLPLQNGDSAYIQTRRRGDLLVGDGRDVFELTEEGDVTMLLRGVESASAP